jgi:type I restriction enzyme S subunit
MTGEWRETTLWDIADYINGRATKPSEVCSDGVPVIKIAELNRGITETTDRVPPELVEDRHWVNPGDLLFAWSGSVGIYRYNGPKAALNQHIFRVVAKEGIDQQFLRYLLLSCMPIFNLHVQDKRTTMGHVTIKDLQRIKVQVPPLAEQRAIAHILGTLDDKIELNRRMSETLEAIAHALFKAWFVDFEPVRAKLEGRWRRGHSLPGLPAHLYDHFPNRLVESELGEIPEGWEVVELGRLISFEKGKKPTTTFPTPCEGCLPVILMETFDGSTAYYAMSEKMVIAQAHDVLMVMDGASSGRVETGYHGVVGSTIAKIVPSEGSRIGHRFVYYALKTLEPEIGEHLTGTSIPHADKGWIARQKVCLPKDGKLLAVFEEIAGQKRKRIEALRAESRTLAALRDALLPKLIRGEIRVKDAERFLEGKGYEVRPREASPSQYAPERV